MLTTHSKPLLRAEMKKRRTALAAAQPLAAEALAREAVRSFDAGKSWPDKTTILAGYWPIQSEISPFPLMQMFEDRGYRLALPTLIARGDDYVMTFRRFSIGDTLGHGPFDILEPAADAVEVLPDMVLVPLLAFDARGYRLGYGGGYYDRALASLRASKRITALGVAFSGQQLADLPVEVHDQRLDGIVTEQGLVEADSQHVSA